MAIFSVTTLNPESAVQMKDAVARLFPATNYQLNDTAWLVAADTTASGLTEVLGVTGPIEAIDHTIVIEMASYFGRANPAIWSWIKANWTKGAAASG